MPCWHRFFCKWVLLAQIFSLFLLSFFSKKVRIFSISGATIFFVLNLPYLAMKILFSFIFLDLIFNWPWSGPHGLKTGASTVFPLDDNMWFWIVWWISFEGILLLTSFFFDRSALRYVWDVAEINLPYSLNNLPSSLIACLMRVFSGSRVLPLV